jgi:mannonate dehydratase
MSAISAVDTALWDIKAKTLDVPLYQLLGGASRDGVLVYGHASGVDIEDTVKAVSEDVALGYKAIRAQSGVPGLQTTYDLGRGKKHYQPAEVDAPTENLWSSELYLEFVPKRVSGSSGSTPLLRWPWVNYLTASTIASS